MITIQLHDQAIFDQVGWFKLKDDQAQVQNDNFETQIPSKVNRPSHQLAKDLLICLHVKSTQVSNANDQRFMIKLWFGTDP